MLKRIQIVSGLFSVTNRIQVTRLLYFDIFSVGFDVKWVLSKGGRILFISITMVAPKGSHRHRIEAARLYLRADTITNEMILFLLSGVTVFSGVLFLY